MNDKDFWEAEDCEFFCHGIYSLALFAFKPALFHSLRLYEGFKALFQFNLTRNSDTFARK
jgi:hypothetical protein